MAKQQNYSEGELIRAFSLTRITRPMTATMNRWLHVPEPTLDTVEQAIFDRILPFAIDSIAGWNEEDLKMNFISQILPIAHLLPNGRYSTFYEKTITGVVDGITLTTKTDFMVATGVLGNAVTPYFHFQEYKPLRRPSGDSMAQLLEAMLIAQEKNSNRKPIYGCEIIGESWRFVVLEGKSYCVSKAYDSIDRDGLLDIIAILRNFKHILETELLDA